MGARLVIPLFVAAIALPARAQPDAASSRLAQLVESHTDDQALATIDHMPRAEQRRPRMRYLRGRLLERMGRHADAAEAYPDGEDAAPLPDAIRVDSRRRRAIALARSGHCSDARTIFASLGDDPVIRARLAECALATGELATAVTELRAVAQRNAREVDLFAIRFELAEALARSGQRDDAIATLTELVVDRPAHPEAATALAALEALRGEPVAFSFDQRMQRATHLYDERRYDDALAELEAAGRPAARPELREWIHRKGMALFDARRRYAEAAQVLAESARLAGPHAADDQFLAARALSRADRDADAIPAYRRFAAQHPEHARAPEALYLAAWLELRRGARGAEQHMQAFLRSAAARREPELAREGLWHLALRAFERRRNAQAARLFEQYAQTSDETLVRARGLYWLGRAKQAARDRRGALAAYRDALRVEPLHWYALLARQRIVELGDDPGPPFPEPAERGEAPAAPAVALPEEVTFYAELGLRADAREALRGHERELRRQAGADGLRALISAYEMLDEPSRLRQLAAGARLVRSTHAPGPRDRWQWDAAYPRPWADRVRTAANAVGLTPAHLYAVMWQESGFDPDAVSYADAIGLMQLIPPTAERVAQRAGIELSRDMLFDPVFNIRLGATYLGGLAERLGVPLCFAAFNGGGHNVQAWLEESGETELDLFVERIPFAQTRNYVRRVTTHLAHYQYLEDPARGWPIELPRTVAPR